jgi:hypothetical protein
MNARPIAVTLISALFIVAGTLGIIYHAKELANIISEPMVVWVLVVRLLAIVGGVFTLRGANWARWLIVVWMAYHVAISFYHTPLEIAIHISFLALAIYALFNSHSSPYFKK